MFNNHLQFISLPRTGHHAIINWVEAQMADFEHIGPLWDRGGCEKSQKITPFSYVEPPPEKNVDWYVWTSEGSSVANLINYLEPMRVPGRKLRVLLTRSLKNWFASLNQWFYDFNGAYPDENFINHMFTIWAEHAVWALHGNRDDLIHIHFDHWFQSAKYRKEKFNELSISTDPQTLEHAESTINTVATAGGGSSFDGMDYDGEAQKMDVLNRWDEVDNVREVTKVLRIRQDCILLDEVLNV